MSETIASEKTDTETNGTREIETKKLVRPLSLEIVLNDPKAIEIISEIAPPDVNTFIEKAIVISEMVLSHASITTSKETVETFFSPLRQDIDQIRTQLSHIVPTVMTPALKGGLTEEAIFQNYEKHFTDDSFEDVSSKGKYSDILATINPEKLPVLIEIKDYKNSVPTAQVDKFWRDMEARDTKYGIFISMRSKIAKISGCITLKRDLNRTAIFVVNHQLNFSGHIFAFYVIKKLVEIASLKKQDLSITEVDHCLTKIHDLLTEIKTTSASLTKINKIADSLKTKNIKDLDEIISLIRVYDLKFKEQIQSAIEEIGKIST